MALGPVIGLFSPKDPGCLYGQVLDGHTGKIRCLSPDEVALPPADAGVDASDGASGDAATARRDAGVDVGAVPVVSASIESLTFDGGEVPRAAAALERIKKDFARCAADHGLAKPEATIELRFLVRAPGKAEGVDVGDVRGMSSEMVRCMKSALAGRSVGAPSSEPVGVSFSVRLKKESGLP
jgi:hypothetical protein